MYICLCKAVTEKAVREACAEGASSLADLQNLLGVATGCGQCAQVACELIDTGAVAQTAAPRQYKNAGQRPANPAF